jgi:hypothetical protein
MTDEARKQEAEVQLGRQLKPAFYDEQGYGG